MATRTSDSMYLLATEKRRLQTAYFLM